MKTANLNSIEKSVGDAKDSVVHYRDEVEYKIKQLVKKHPFIMMGAAITAGYLAHLVLEKVLDEDRP